MQLNEISEIVYKTCCVISIVLGMTMLILSLLYLLFIAGLGLGSPLVQTFGKKPYTLELAWKFCHHKELKLRMQPRDFCYYFRMRISAGCIGLLVGIAQIFLAMSLCTWSWGGSHGYGCVHVSFALLNIIVLVLVLLDSKFVKYKADYGGPLVTATWVYALAEICFCYVTSILLWALGFFVAHPSGGTPQEKKM